MGQLYTMLAVILGWALNEMSFLVRSQREDRRAVGPVLKDLLETRHRLFKLDAIMKELGKQFQIPAQAQMQLKQFIHALVPEPPNSIERYEEAVTTLARAEPLLAFRLGNQPLIGRSMDLVRNLASSDQSASEFWVQVGEPELLRRIQPDIEELILDVARARGWRTWWYTRELLRKPVLSQDDMDSISDYLAKLKTAIEGGTKA